MEHLFSLLDKLVVKLTRPTQIEDSLRFAREEIDRSRREVLEVTRQEGEVRRELSAIDCTSDASSLSSSLLSLSSSKSSSSLSSLLLSSSKSSARRHFRYYSRQQLNNLILDSEPFLVREPLLRVPLLSSYAPYLELHLRFKPGGIAHTTNGLLRLPMGKLEFSERIVRNPLGLVDSTERIGIVGNIVRDALARRERGRSIIWDSHPPCWLDPRDRLPLGRLERLPSCLYSHFHPHSLGFSYIRSNIRSDALLFPYSRVGSGLLCLVNENIDSTLVVIDVLTNYQGLLGRFFALVSVGIGCTVWSTFVPTGLPLAEYADLLIEFDTLDHFLQDDFHLPGYRRDSFLEREEVSPSFMSTLVNDVTSFNDLEIYANDEVGHGVGVGLMLVFLLVVGVATIGNE